MRYGRFVAGVAVGIAIGAVAPVLAQSVSQILGGSTYGIPRGVLSTLYCVESSGVLAVNSSLHAGVTTRAVGSGFATGYQIACNQ